MITRTDETWRAVRIADRASIDYLNRLFAEGWYLMFIDADKKNYDHYGEWAIANLRPGGLVLGDNAYLFGKLVDDTDTARAMRRFHERVAATCESVCLPTPDGLVVGIKK